MTFVIIISYVHKNSNGSLHKKFGFYKGLKEKIRPRCGSHAVFDLIKACWVSEGAARPDARQLYKKLKQVQLSTNVPNLPQ